MKYTISKSFEFSAAHRLKLVPDGHKCKTLHGHNYKVTIGLQAERLDEQRMVIDYAMLAPIKGYLTSKFDHQDLNKALYPMETTAEQIAFVLVDDILHDKVPALNSKVAELLQYVSVKETEGTEATCWI